MLLFFEELIAIRRPIRSHSPPEIGQNINTDISASEVQLIDHEGNNLGIVPTQQALQRANDASLDLVEIAPNASPPVCKILDYGRFKYHAQKKAAEARKRQKIVEVKEVKMRPNIDTHDYDVKIRNMRRFFSDGDKVKVTLRFRGREMAHQNLGMDLLERVRTDLSEITKVESSPRLEGRQMIMILAPLI